MTEPGPQQDQRRQHQSERLRGHGQPEKRGGDPPAPAPRKDDRGQQQADADAVRMRGEGDLLDDQGAPGVEEDAARGRQAEQQDDDGQVDRDQDRLQHGDARRLDPERDEEDELRDRSVDRLQLRVVDAIQDALEDRRHRRIDEELLRRGAVRRAGRGEPVAIPEVAVEVVLVERAADQSAKPEADRPEQQSTDREGFPGLPKVEEQAEDRESGPGDEEEERPQVGLTWLSREPRQNPVAQDAPETDPVYVLSRGQPTPSSRTRGDRSRRLPGAEARPGFPPTRRPAAPAG